MNNTERNEAIERLELQKSRCAEGINTFSKYMDVFSGMRVSEEKKDYVALESAIAALKSQSAAEGKAERVREYLKDCRYGFFNAEEYDEGNCHGWNTARHDILEILEVTP